MNSKIFDSVLHGELKPWKVDIANTNFFIQLLKAAGKDTPTTKQQLQRKQIALLAPYLSLLEFLKQSQNNKSENLQKPRFSTPLPTHTNALTQYYSILIADEALRFYNQVIDRSVTWTEPVDIQYQTGKIFRALIVLTKRISEELLARSYSVIPDAQADLTHFALYHLKQTTILLYFNIQAVFSGKLASETTIEDFYILEIEEPLETIINLIAIGNQEESKAKKPPKSEKLTFGFNGRKEKLQYVINQLCIQVDLLNEEVSPADELLQLLFSKDIKPGAVNIRLNCDNKTFRYVIQCLSPFFDFLSFVNIELSKSFYSKQGNVLKANSFSKARSFDPKGKATIDNIFKQMQ